MTNCKVHGNMLPCIACRKENVRKYERLAEEAREAVKAAVASCQHDYRPVGSHTVNVDECVKCGQIMIT